MRPGKSKSIWEIDFLEIEARIAARRERIRKRIEAAKRLSKLLKIQKMMVFKGEEDDAVLVELAANIGDINIHNDDHNGIESISNILLSRKFLHVERRNKVKVKNEAIKKILDEEDAEMQRRFEQLAKSWPEEGEKVKGSPTQLFNDILVQKEVCNEMLMSKNQLIEMIEDENRQVDESYKELIEEYNTNISLLSGRMEFHIHSFESLLTRERKSLHNAYSLQKTKTLERGENTFEDLLEGVVRSSEEQLESRLALVEEQAEEMDEVVINDYEQLGETQQSMEGNLRSLEEQIEMIEAITHLNTERLDYEIHVLNKHEEENAIIKSEQKRKLTVMQDTANRLKARVNDAEKDFEKEKCQLEYEVKLIKSQIRDMEEKQKKFGVQSEKKREEMARMMKNEAYILLEKITENDKVFHGTYLNQPFKKTSESRLTKKKLLTCLDTKSTSKRFAEVKDITSKEDTREKNKNIKHILLTLIEKADFLVEEDLNALMGLLPDDDKLLLKVDAILSTLGVKEEKDIEKMFDHLTAKFEDDQLGREKDIDTKNTVTAAEKRSKILKIIREYTNKDSEVSEKSKTVLGTFDAIKAFTGRIQPDKEGHLWDELKESIKEFKSPDRIQLKKLLTEYKDILLARSDLMKRNEELRTQNSQLKQLLKNYLKEIKEDF